VVEVTEKYTILLCRDGTFRNIPRSQAAPFPLIGQIVTYSDQTQERKRHLWAKLTALASAAVLLLALTTAYLFLPLESTQAAHIVAVDINPSLEMEADEKWKVIAIRPLNDDAKYLIATLDWEEQPVTDVIRQVVEQSVLAGYLRAGEEALVSVSVIDRDKEEIQSDPSSESPVSNQPISNEIETTVQKTLSNHAIVGTVEVVKEKSTNYDQAKQANLSVNKYRVYESLAKTGVIRSPDEVKEKSMAELKQLEKKNHEKKGIKDKKSKDKKNDKRKHSKPIDRNTDSNELKAKRLKSDKEKEKSSEKKNKVTSKSKQNKQKLKQKDKQEKKSKKSQKDNSSEKKDDKKKKNKKRNKEKRDNKNNKETERTKDKVHKKGDQDKPKHRKKNDDRNPSDENGSLNLTHREVNYNILLG
jgi:hypothetical protein